jgi:hypothetical protein
MKRFKFLTNRNLYELQVVPEKSQDAVTSESHVCT